MGGLRMSGRGRVHQSKVVGAVAQFRVSGWMCPSESRVQRLRPLNWLTATQKLGLGVVRGMGTMRKPRTLLLPSHAAARACWDRGPLHGATPRAFKKETRGRGSGIAGAAAEWQSSLWRHRHMHTLNGINRSKRCPFASGLPVEVDALLHSKVHILATSGRPPSPLNPGSPSSRSPKPAATPESVGRWFRSQPSRPRELCLVSTQRRCFSPRSASSSDWCRLLRAARQTC